MFKLYQAIRGQGQAPKVQYSQAKVTLSFHTFWSCRSSSSLASHSVYHALTGVKCQRCIPALCLGNYMCQLPRSTLGRITTWIFIINQSLATCHATHQGSCCYCYRPVLGIMPVNTVRMRNECRMAAIDKVLQDLSHFRPRFMACDIRQDRRCKFLRSASFDVIFFRATQCFLYRLWVSKDIHVACKQPLLDRVCLPARAGVSVRVGDDPVSPPVSQCDQAVRRELTVGMASCFCLISERPIVPVGVGNQTTD